MTTTTQFLNELASVQGAEGAAPGDVRKSGLLNGISQCLSARDLAIALARHIGDADITAAVHEKLGKVK